MRPHRELTGSFIAIVTLVWAGVAQAAGPAPNETAESQTYDIQLSSRQTGTFNGQLVFQGDPDRPQDLESGDLQLVIELEENEATGEGSWWAWDYGFVGFFIVTAETDSGGQLFGYGIAFGDRLFARAGILDDEDLNGRYRLRGQMTEEEEPEEIEAAPSDATETQPAAP